MARTLAEQAFDLQRVTAGLVKKFQFRDRNDTVAYGLSVSQAYSLRALAERGPLTMGELAEDLGLSLSTMTRSVHPLVEQALLRRVSDPSDRRVCRIELTKEGQSLWSKIEGELVANDVEVLRTIAPSEREAVIRALAALSGAIDAWRAEKKAQSSC